MNFPVVTTSPRDCRPSGHIVELVAYLVNTVGDHALTVIQGGAAGGDRYVEEACDALGVVCRTELAHWTAPCDIEGGWCRPGHRRRRGDGTEFCPAAGPRRNARMLDRYDPLLAIAVLDRPLRSTKGTRGMMALARSQGRRTVEFDLRLALVEALPPVAIAVENILSNQL